MRKCSFMVQETSTDLMNAIRVVQPTLIVSLAHDKSFWVAVRASWPEILLVGRLYEEGADWRQVEAVEWASRCASFNMCYHAWLTWNEPRDIYNWVTPENARLHDEWCIRFREAILGMGYEAVGLNVPAGHWHGDAICQHLPRVCQSYRYISLHEYSARAMWDQQPKLMRPVEEVPPDEGDEVGWWYTLRYRAWYEAIVERWPERAGQFEILVTECGVAYGVMVYTFGDVGWQTDMSEQQYVDSLKWYFAEMNEDDYARGGAIFIVGAADKNWSSFETLPLAERLAEIAEVGQVEPEPGPSPPEPEEVNMDIKVYDLEQQEQNLDYAEEKYGVEIERAEVEPGQLVWRVVELWEKTGYTTLITQTLGEEGLPMAEVDVAFYWPDAPDPPDPPTEVTEHDWYPNFVHGPTNINGDIGPGMGKGAYHGRGEGGPHAVWIRDPDIPSDIVRKLGMLAGTFHDHLDQKFRLMRVGEEPEPTEPEPPPTPPGKPGEALTLIADIRQRLDRLEVVLGEWDQLAEELAGKM